MKIILTLIALSIISGFLMALVYFAVCFPKELKKVVSRALEWISGGEKSELNAVERYEATAMLEKEINDSNNNVMF